MFASSRASNSPHRASEAADIASNSGPSVTCSFDTAHAKLARNFESNVRGADSASSSSNASWPNKASWRLSSTRASHVAKNWRSCCLERSWSCYCGTNVQLRAPRRSRLPPQPPKADEAVDAAACGGSAQASGSPPPATSWSRKPSCPPSHGNAVAPLDLPRSSAEASLAIVAAAAHCLAASGLLEVVSGRKATTKARATAVQRRYKAKSDAVARS